MTRARSNAYGSTTLGSTALTLAGTTTTVAGLTLSSPAINTGYLTSPKEYWTISATAATGTIQFDCLTQGVLFTQQHLLLTGHLTLEVTLVQLLPQ